MISQEIQTNELINSIDQDNFSNGQTTSVNEIIKVNNRNINENKIVASSQNEISDELIKSNETEIEDSKIIMANITPTQQIEVNSDQPKELINIKNCEENKLSN